MQKVQDEKYLVNEVLSGNKRAFVQLIRQYEGLVLHIVTPLIGVNEDREDICQDVFIKVYEKLNTFQFKSKLSTWIGNIAYNSSINYLQKKKNVLLSNIVSTENELSFIDSINIETDNPEKISIRREDISQLNQSINILPEFQKTVLLLFYKEEISLDEISKILEIPVNTVKSHLFRARNSLKQLMTKKETI
ncbi:MAG: sigma-70 family RNA polymerase sigma factor [Bacteroidetes bacterium]|nr:sigma-70 family RNA polymerase sigma factor [Bacteroidota bacterium]